MRTKRLCGAALLMAGLMFGVGCGGGEPPRNSPPRAAGTTAGSGQAEADPAEKEELYVVRLEFEDVPHLGKDPFFPKSTRRAPEMVTAESGPGKGSSSGFEDLEVKAIIMTNPPRAWINNRSFVPGEKGSVRLANGEQLPIYCVEIHSDSVVVQVEGVPGHRKLPIQMKR